MSSGGLALSVAILAVAAILGVLIFAVVRSIQVHRSGHRAITREFGLGLLLMVLFVVSWAAQVVAQWQQYTDEQLSHAATPQAGDFAAEFLSATLQNWQSEFLQLFSFVVLAALLIHKGSAESKDGDERLEASLRRIEERLGTLPPTATRESWELPDTSLEANDGG